MSVNELDYYCRKVLENAEVIDVKAERELTKYLGKRGKKAREAQQKLVQANLRLVVSIAKEYQNLGIDLEDLVSEGNIGLLKAVEKYNPSKGTKLSYYASFWIRQSIMRSLSNKSRTIRLPVGAADLYLKMLKFKNKYKEENENEEPTIKEIAKGLGVSVQRVKVIVDGSGFVKSLNFVVKKNEEETHTEFGDILADSTTGTPDEAAGFFSDAALLKKLIKKLDVREQYIINNRFGIGGDDPKTLEKIGKEYNISRERIRQIQIEVTEKLRRMYRRIKHENSR